MKNRDANDWIFPIGGLTRASGLRFIPPRKVSGGDLDVCRRAEGTLNAVDFDLCFASVSVVVSI